MVGMLVIACVYCGDCIGHGFFGRAFFGKAADITKPRHPRFPTELHPGRKCRRIVKRANSYVEMLAGGIIIHKWRSAIPTKTPYDGLGTLEKRWRAARPCKCLARNANQRCEEVTHSFLAHPAVADMRAIKHRIRAIADGAALASTGGDDGNCVHDLAFAAFREQRNI